MAGPKQAPEPWRSFLRELDQQATEETRLECMGGFVVTVRPSQTATRSRRWDTSRVGDLCITSFWPHARDRGVKKKTQVQQQEPEEFLALASTSPTWSPREYSADGP